MDINQIYNMDCFEGMKLMKDKSINSVVTSPPYNRKRNDKYKDYNDDIEDYFAFLCNFTDECLRLSKDYVFVNIQKNFYNKKDVFNYIGHYSDKIVEIIIWEKSNPMPASGFNITNAYEFFICLADKPLKSNKTYTKNTLMTPVNSQTTLKNHRAVMRTDVCEWFVTMFTKEEDVILDPFMGSGTTAVACKLHNRNYVGFEISQEYHQISIERIQDLN